MQLPPDFKEFLKLLNSRQVKYLLIGGYAVSYYGYPRATGDMDIWIAIEPTNAAKICEVLKEFGFMLLTCLKICSYRQIKLFAWEFRHYDSKS